MNSERKQEVFSIPDTRGGGFIKINRTIFSLKLRIIDRGLKDSSVHFVNLLSSLSIVVHNLEPHDADPVTPVVVDVLGPG